MISLQSVVMLVLYLLGAACVFGLLYYAINYMQTEWGGPELFYKAARTLLVVLAVLIIIGVIISLVSGSPVVRW